MHTATSFFFFFNDTATTEIYTLSLHDALPISLDRASFPGKVLFRRLVLLPLILPGIITGLSLLMFAVFAGVQLDRKSTRLNSSHSQISYAVFCLKKKTNTLIQTDIILNAR